MTPEEQAEKLVSEWRLAGTPIDDRLVRLIATALAEKDAEIRSLKNDYETAKSWHAKRDESLTLQIADLRAEIERLKELTSVVMISRLRNQYDEQVKKNDDLHIQLADTRQRLFGNRKVTGSDHSTACSIWGDDGRGGTIEQFKQPLPCNCGALENYFSAQLAEAKKAMKNVPDPEQEGVCPNCSRMELVNHGDYYYWQHLGHCWYFQLQAALAAEEPK